MNLFSRKGGNRQPAASTSIITYTEGDKNCYVIARADPLRSMVYKAASLSPAVEIFEDTDDTVGAAIPIDWLRVEIPH